jgi:hypothetical protein
VRKASRPEDQRLASGGITPAVIAAEVKQQYLAPSVGSPLTLSTPLGNSFLRTSAAQVAQARDKVGTKRPAERVHQGISVLDVVWVYFFLKDDVFNRTSDILVMC